ncbi:MAG: hypothetical protein NVV63_13590 [Opitutus sp.]|nr:hypothetical protein [Opitutus sp.]
MRLNRLGELRLALEFRQAFFELRERETFSAVAVVGREIEQREHVRVHDLERAVCVGLLGLEEHIEQPRGGREGFSFGGLGALLALKHEQRRARDRIERLYAAIDDDRQTAEAGDVEGLGVFRTAQRGKNPERGESDDDVGEKSFHDQAARRRVMKPARWNTNW